MNALDSVPVGAVPSPAALVPDLAAMLAQFAQAKAEMQQLGVMATAVVPGKLWTLEDLMLLWQPPGETDEAKRRWIWRRVREWNVPHDGSVKDPRFWPAKVIQITAKRTGG